LTKAELIELFGESLRGGDNSDDTKRKYHPEVLAAYLDLAIEAVHSDTIKKNQARESFDPSGLDLLTKTIDCIDVECVKGRYGFALPIEIAGLPGGIAIRMVSNNSFTQRYERVSVMQVAQFGDLPGFTGGKWYSVNGDFVSIYNDKPKHVTIVVIPKLRSLDDDDEVNFIEGSGAEVFTVAKQLAREHKLTPEDNTNQGISDFK